MSDVAIVMGSDSDWPVMEEAAAVLDKFGISYSAAVVSAHRMPLEMVSFAQSAKAAGTTVQFWPLVFWVSQMRKSRRNYRII
jgi:5-(carboxyamino)imidazole ribonucleotide mutase